MSLLIYKEKNCQILFTYSSFGFASAFLMNNLLQSPLKEPGPLASDFFQIFGDLVPEESSYFSHYPW